MMKNARAPEAARDALPRSLQAGIARRFKTLIDGLRSLKAILRALRTAAGPDRENGPDQSSGRLPHREATELGIAARRDRIGAIGECDRIDGPANRVPVQASPPEVGASSLKQHERVTSYISSLDDNYVLLKRAAALIARARSGLDADDVMETFKHAVFARELERKETAIEGAMPAEDWDAPLLRIEAPPTEWPSAPRLPSDLGPHEYFAVKATTVAEFLASRGALPGRPEAWSAFTTPLSCDCQTREDQLGALAHIPYAVFPPEAKAILGDIVLSKVKLRAWMKFKGYALPAFLRDVGLPADPGTVAPAKAARARAPRGRRSLPGWARIGELIRAAHAENPDTPRKKLAIDARTRAAAEFPSQRLPTWQTIVRHMKAILENRPLH